MSKLDELRARKEAREAARASEEEALEVEALELVEKYEAAGKKQGVDFEVISTSVGNFAVRKPDFTVGKKFSDIKDKGTEDVFTFVDPCVMHPDTMTARGIFQEHGGIPWVLANALLKMYEGAATQKRGK